MRVGVCRYEVAPKLAGVDLGTETDKNTDQLLCYHKLGTPQVGLRDCLRAASNSMHAVQPDCLVLVWQRAGPLLLL